MSNNRTILVVDCETTGLNPNDGHEITELAAIAINPWNLEPHHVGRFHMYFKPKRPELAGAAVMRVAGPSFNEACKNGVDPKVGLQAFAEWVRKANDSGKDSTKPLLAGHNHPFDRRFLNYESLEYKIFKKEDDAPWHSNFIDTWSWSLALYENDPSVNGLSLNIVLDKLSMKRTGETHGAMEDTELTTQLLVRYLAFFRRCRKQMRVGTPEEIKKLNNNEAKAQ